MLQRRRFLALAALAGIHTGPAAAADTAPRPLRLVVPFPPGGGADNLARTIMPRVEAVLGQTILIDNRPGAGGNLGAELVARAAPDGQTLLYGTNGTHSINASLYSQLRFDPIQDFAPIARLTAIPAMLIVNPQLPVHSLAELLSLARTQPGRLNFASAGNGTTSHLSGELFKVLAGVDIVHVPYRGGALAMTDLIGGQVQMMIDVMPNALPMVRSGRVRGLAVSTAQRVRFAPEFPTIDEAGVPGFESSAWDGILAPAGTPPALVHRLNQAIQTALQDPALVEALARLGAQPVRSTPQEFARHILASTDKWAAVVRGSGAKVD